MNRDSVRSNWEVIRPNCNCASHAIIVSSGDGAKTETKLRHASITRIGPRTASSQYSSVLRGVVEGSKKFQQRVNSLDIAQTEHIYKKEDMFSPAANGIDLQHSW